MSLKYCMHTYIPIFFIVEIQLVQFKVKKLCIINLFILIILVFI